LFRQCLNPYEQRWCGAVLSEQLGRYCKQCLQNTMMMGADMYETEDEIARLMSDGKVPIGVGENTKIR
jgi:hypothetical protein